MAIDSMLYHATIAAGTYTTGQVINMNLVRGPSVVRDGCGTAKLKKIVTFINNSPGVAMPISVSVLNGNWNDPVINPAPNFSSVSFQNGKSVQKGGNCELVVNSGFTVTAKIMNGNTSTSAVDVFCLIDIDYSSYPSVENPEDQDGTPCSIQFGRTIPYTAVGNAPAWSSESMDIFKAGYRYLLTGAFMDALTAAAAVGFISITGAAGQGGLERIIPLITDAAYLGVDLIASTPMTKGPMTVNYAVYGVANTAVDVQLDFIKR